MTDTVQIAIIVGLAPTIVAATAAYQAWKANRTSSAAREDVSVVKADVHQVKETATATAEQVRVQSVQNAEKLDTIHEAVNSERTALLAELRGMNQEVLRLSKVVATDLERRAGPTP